MKTPALPFFETPESVDLRKPMAPASLQQWERIKETLTARELEVLHALCRYCETHDDATGGELAVFMGVPVTSTRPRLTGLHEKSLVTRTTHTRASRIRGELACHAYAPTVSRAAVARAIKEQQ